MRSYWKLGGSSEEWDRMIGISSSSDSNDRGDCPPTGDLGRGMEEADQGPFAFDGEWMRAGTQCPSLIAIRSPLLDPPDIAGGLSGSRYWTLASDSVAFPGHLSSTLAGPSSVVVGDLFPSSSFSRETSANLAALAIPPPGMGTALDALTTHQPLNSRRPAAPTLPSFELPAPNFQTSVKYAHHNPPPINPSVSNLLTPPATTQSGEKLPATTSHTATTTAPTNPELAPYWQSQSAYQSGSGAAAARQSWNSSVVYPSRDTFSPSVNSLNRNPATSTPGTEHIAQPYEMNHLPPFHQSASVSAAAPLQAGAPQQHHAMTHAMLSAHNPLPNPTPSPHPLPSNDPYMVKSSSAPAYGTIQQLSSPPGGYSPYGQQGIVPNRVASNPHPSHHLNYQRQPWPSYSLPAMNGPIWTNVHNPNGQMSLTGNLQSGVLPGLPGYNSGHVANMQQMQQLYGGHPPHPGHGAPGPTNDRPFKCDQCPQSFNRNHDLKRHKRIHLSVKPFPCTHCDKSFSRKDALKRHILVKGCGKDGSDGMKPGDHGMVKEEDRSDESNGQH
ncbi:C2H2 finger domain protein [Aspergillus eucalypticola CBS 122712]|uniref:C2H2 finger domain protein n=1 Tax=Aspergillus eucalypticola (strain CBS 122712 / IBT 29274) TaxID=1448314 RepID=A0A317VNL8_ASPEC|nr:C2H2 finger domain protein [Aspergillus eucalypticola CBS 122712]PWY75933.1 C2H2 finger domain protein [Aspergillus eucalypticola CBS 122712]